MNSKDEFKFDFVFVLQYIAPASSMLRCLLGQVASYLFLIFYSKQPTEVNGWIHINHISPQVTKRRAGKCEGSNKEETCSF